MDSNFLLDLSIIGAFAKENGKWIRQRDVRFVAERMWSLSGVQEDFALHNTQILRRLEGLYNSKLVNRKDGPEYMLSGVGCVFLLQSCRKVGVRHSNFQAFLLIHYFLSTYREHLLKILKADPSVANVDIGPILNSRQLVQERMTYLTELEKSWTLQVEKGGGLIEGERSKKIWQPNLEWIRHQQKILSQI